MRFKEMKTPKDEASSMSRLRLPKNRWQSFWDCVSNQSSKLLSCGFCTLLFALPLIVVWAITNILIYDLNLQIDLGELTAVVGAQKIFDTMNTANLLTIPALMVLFVGLSGEVRIVRRLIWQEDVFFWFDFKKGIKENAGSFLITGLLLGVANWVVQTLIRYGYFVGNSAWYDIVLPISIAAGVLLLPIFTFTLFQTDLYSLPYLAKLKNSFLLAMRTAPSTFLAMFLVCAPWAALFISMDEVLYLILVAVFVVFLVPLELLALNEYSLHIFDRFINQANHPEIFDKGIYRHAQNKD